MARVSKAYLEARRRQILQAAQRCFTRDGFHTAPMLDIVREAGLSAGAVYRYFPSKDDLIAAVARESVASSTAAVAAVIDASMAADPPLAPGELFEQILRTYERHPEGYKLLLRVQNEAVHSPAIAQEYIAGEVKVHRIFTGVVETYQSLGVMSLEYDAKDIGAVLAGLLHSHLARWKLLDKHHNAAYRRG